MRRLWHRDSSVYDGFHMLCAILHSENVGVCCIQETNAGAFPTLPIDQPYQYDGPSESYGREAGFLIRSGVCCTPVPGIQDSVSMRWRIFGGVVCVCSYYAPHVGIPEADRVSFWQNLIEATRHVRSTVDHPLIVAGDANVWHPAFSLGRSRSQDNLITPLVDLLVSSCGLSLVNPRDQATHIGGAALDLVFVSIDCPSTLHIHDGVSCCHQAPG